MPVGPSRCSVTAEPAWRFDRLDLGEIEIDNHPQGLGRRAVTLIVRQSVKPGGVFRLQVGERGDCVTPALDPATAIDRTAEANDRCAADPRGTVARLTFGAGHGGITDR